MKHEGGWLLRQHQPGHFTWTSRLGQRYDVHPPPIIEPLPEPMPVPRPPDLPDVKIDDDEPIWAEPPRRPAPEPRPEPDPADDIPPF